MTPWVSFNIDDLLKHPDHVAEDTQADIAADLGLSLSTVYRAREILQKHDLIIIFPDPGTAAAAL